MAASNLDKFKKSKRKFETTVGVGGILAGGTTLPLTSVTGLDTSTAVTLVVGAGTATEEVITGVVSGSDLINCVRGKEGTTDSAHSAGETVNMFFTETHWDDMVDGILVSHDQDGTLKDGAVDAASVLASNVVTTAKIADDAVTAAKLDGVDKSLLTTDSNPYKFSAYRNAAANSGNGAFAKISFDTENFDTNNNFSSGTYTAPINGFYFIQWTTAFGAGAQDIASSLYLNGSEYRRGGEAKGDAVSGTSMSGSDIIQMTAGNTIDIYAYGATTVALQVGSKLTYISGFLISRT